MGFYICKRYLLLAGWLLPGPRSSPTHTYAHHQPPHHIHPSTSVKMEIRDDGGMCLAKMGQTQQKEAPWEEMFTNFKVRNNCLRIYLSVEFMKEGDEWKNLDTQNGDHDTPRSAGLSSHCGLPGLGHSEDSCLRACPPAGCTAWLCQDRTLASWFSKGNFSHSGSLA